jgi:acyl-CoA synthetase (AMP-forming)/AMP-acid ligase II
MDAMARGLLARGLTKGDRVVLYLTNDAVREVVLTALGCYRIGAIVVPLNPRSGEEELQHALSLVEPSFIVCTTDAMSKLGTLYPAAKLLVLNGEPYARGSWPEPESEVHDFTLPALPESEDASVMLFTSGTTAKPKAVVHCHRSQLFCGYAVSGALGLTTTDIYQGAWPVYTSSVLNMACMAAWVAGSAVVLEEVSLDNEGRLRLIQREACTVYHGVTSPLHFMIDEYQKGNFDLSRVRRIGYGGATMPVEVIDKFRKHLPWADQVHIWGMTETGPAGTYLPPWYLPRKAGCIGMPQPGCVIQVLDEKGEPLGIDEPGEIAFAGLSMALGYFRNDAATQETFVDGWVRTGDIGIIDREGHLHFLDRKKDIINRGGLKIASAAVEDVIYRYPGILEAAAIAVPHPKLGEDIVACIVTVSGVPLDEQALRVHCAQYLADYQVPRRCYMLESLPKSPMGKILKRDLRTLVCKIESERDTHI